MEKLQLKRVVITVLAITSTRDTVTEDWQGLAQGRSGVAPITCFDTAKHDCYNAAEAKGVDPCDYLECKEVKRMERYAHFAVSASL